MVTMEVQFTPALVLYSMVYSPDAPPVAVQVIFCTVQPDHDEAEVGEVSANTDEAELMVNGWLLTSRLQVLMASVTRIRALVVLMLGTVHTY